MYTDTTVRHRGFADPNDNIDDDNSRQHPNEVRPTTEESDMDDRLNEESYSSDDGNAPNVGNFTKDLPQSSDSLGTSIDDVLGQLPPRWRNWVVRGIFTFVMISIFAFIIKQGAKWLMMLVFIIQFKCFHEIISIGLAVYRLFDLPWFRALSWYFLLTSNYFFFGESLIDYWSILLRKDEFLHFLVAHHRLISFTLYCIGFVWFVLSLKKSSYMRQFSLFAWTHVTLLLIVSQSFLIIQNIFQGLVWFLVPISMVICCDIMSYMFGFFFGKTPLIKLSPKKTWEGFIGGAFSTIIFGLILSYILLSRPFFVCPLESYTVDNTNCTIPASFMLREMGLPRPFSFLFKLFGKKASLYVYPFLGHTIIMALFASILGPFGGFFASGFKRAFKIKDFGDVIPGHGGLMDRFDCQLLMGTFVNVYIHTFIKVPNPSKLLQQIMWLSDDEQLLVFTTLWEQLIQSGLVTANGTIISTSLEVT